MEQAVAFRVRDDVRVLFLGPAKHVDVARRRPAPRRSIALPEEIRDRAGRRRRAVDQVDVAARAETSPPIAPRARAQRGLDADDTRLETHMVTQFGL